MTCPFCNQKIHEAAETCPHCGRDAEFLDQYYRHIKAEIFMFNDAAGIFKASERKKIEKQISVFRKEFPDCFLTVHAVGLLNDENVQSYGVWALNCPDYQNFPSGASSDSGISIILDLNNKQVGLCVGYQLEPYFEHKSTFNILTVAHPHLTESNYSAALLSIIKKLRFSLMIKSYFSNLILKKKRLTHLIHY